MTLTSLPSMTATHEFVVPRSMPIILPICGISFNGPAQAGRLLTAILALDTKLQPFGALRGPFCVPSVDHFVSVPAGALATITIAGPHQSAIQGIALLQHLEHRPRFRPVAFNHADRLVELRVERLARGIDLHDLGFRKRVQEQSSATVQPHRRSPPRSPRRSARERSRLRARDCRPPAASRWQTARARICARFRRRAGCAGGRFRTRPAPAVPALAPVRPRHATLRVRRSAHRPSVGHPSR